MIEVTILVAVYNAEKYLRECLDSLLKQTLQEIQVICINDASTDSSLSIIQEYAQKDKRIEYISLKENKGQAHARNVGLQQAKGKYICFLDSDDLWEPTKLEKQIYFMEKNNYVFSYHEYVEIDEKGKELGIYVSGKNHVGKFDMYSCCWPGCLSVMYDAKKIGLIQINDIKKNNDTAMWLKVIRKADCYLLPECLGKYRRRANSITPKPIWQRIWAHYPLFHVAEEMSPVAATFWVVMNVFGNAYKKWKYVKRYKVD